MLRSVACCVFASRVVSCFIWRQQKQFKCPECRASLSRHYVNSLFSLIFCWDYDGDYSQFGLDQTAAKQWSHSSHQLAGMYDLNYGDLNCSVWLVAILLSCDNQSYFNSSINFSFSFLYYSLAVNFYFYIIVVFSAYIILVFYLVLRK